MSWLAWLALIVLVVAALVAKVRRSGIVVFRQGMPGRSGWHDLTGKIPDAASKPEAVAERMLRCEHCGIHFPESEAVRRAGAVFCCQEHSLRHFPH